MTFGEKWSFLLDYSLYAMLSEIAASCLRGERLVGDVLKRFGDLNSILDLSRANKTLGIADIRGGKLGRSATSRLGKVREVFRMKSANAAVADTSRS
jgi:hypothetical protein